MTIGAFNWWKWALQLVLATLLSDLALAQAPTCTCPGQQVNVSGHASCFQVVRDSGGSWTAADKKCSNLGGFIAHVDSPALLGNLTSYIQQNYQQQLMTGGLVGNAEYQLIAMMCPNNSFLGVLNTTIAATIINGNASAATGSCLFLRNTDFKLHYGNCNETSDVLCEIPMDSDETCGVMMQCAASSTSSPWSSQRPNASNPPPAAAGNVNPPPQNQNAANPPNSITSPPPPPRSSSRSPFAINSASSNPQSPAPFPPTGGSNPPPPPSNSSVQPMMAAMNQPLAGSPPPSNSTGSSRPTSSNSSGQQGQTTASFGPMNSTGTWPTYAPLPTNGTTSDSCGSGYTKLGRWCLPWWAWLVFGLLLFVAIFACTMCFVFMCIGNRKKKVYVVDNTPQRLSSQELKRNDTQSTISNTSQPNVYDVKAYNDRVGTPNDLMAPVPHQAISSPSMPMANERMATSATSPVYV